MTVSRAVRRHLSNARTGVPSKKGQASGSYPMPDKKHARLAKAFAAMHHSPNKAAIDRKADAILRSPHGSGPFGPDDIVNGYAAMDPSGVYGALNSWEQNEQALTANKKKKKGGQ